MSGVTLATAVPPSGSVNGIATSPAPITTTTGAVELTESGGRALKLQTDTPHLVSLGGGRLSTAVTLHPIPQGRITLGSGPGVDITVQGTGVEALHCHIENSGGIVTLYPLSENLSVDGVPVRGPTRLSQGVMLTIGRSNYMRFNHPAEAQLMKSVLPNARISMAPIKFEADTQPTDDTRYTKKPPVMPRKSPRESVTGASDEEPPSNIQMKVSKFEYLAAQNFKKSISPKVFSANLVTVNTPAKDVLGRAPPDLQDFAKNLPQAAVNYSDSSCNDKQKNKTPDRQFFGRKSPQYVNVAVVNETKSINNKVAIYENGCVPKQHPNVYLNVNLEQQPKNELNNMNNNSGSNNSKNTNASQGNNKSINVTRAATTSPSPSFNRNPPPYFRSVTPSPVSMLNADRSEQNRSGSLGEINRGCLVEAELRKNEAEVRWNQAHADRVKEQETEKAEQARLEEILNMCAEYERQVQWEKNNKPTPNRIKTNGSLPRDKRHCLSPSSNHTTPSPGSKDSPVFRFDYEPLTPSPSGRSNNSYENVSIINRLPSSPPSSRDTSSRFHYENVEVRPGDGSPHIQHNSPYENVHVIHQNSSPSPPCYPQSPRTRIKTIPTTPKESSPRDTAAQIIENKFAVLNAEQYLLQNRNKEIPSENREDGPDASNRKPTPTKFILPIEYEDRKRSPSSPITGNHEAIVADRNARERQNEADRLKEEALKKEKQEIVAAMANIKRKMADIEMQEEELNRELEMERALITGEHKSKLLELEELENHKRKLSVRAREIETKMEDCQVTQMQHQDNCRRKLQSAQDSMACIEQKLSEAAKGTPQHRDLFEEFLNAQEALDNERKTFEDLEFHHLEEEADWLASREEIQREIVDLTKRAEAIELQASELEQQKIDAGRCNAQESKTLERQLIKYLRRLEEHRNKLRAVEAELRTISKQESDQEVSSDSDSDKVKDVGPGNVVVQNLSCSFIVESNAKVMRDDNMFNMSQSFNEKLLQEKLVLEDGIVFPAKRCPSQDDIDRISKVTSSAPLNIEDGRGSLGKKTIESLKEIERNRQLHLVQQGSQVIEEERRRVLALKQRVQHEVRAQWAQRQQDCTSLTSTGSEDAQNSITGSDEIDQKQLEAGSGGTVSPSDGNRDRKRPESNGPESPSRPLSETSETSVEVGGTLGRRRPRQLVDKTRPLTRYLPIRSSELDLRQHIESAGHQVVLCPHVVIDSSSCRGFLHKRGSKLNGWSRRWFVFDRNRRALVYYADKSEKKVRGGAYFQAIEEVYLDHSNSVRSPNPHLTFVIKTRERHYYLMAPSPEAMRIWIDVVFTGAEGYQEFEHGT